MLELGRTKAFHRSLGEAEKATKGYDVLVVGLSRSRGVDGVMPIDPMKGTRRGQRFNV